MHYIPNTQWGQALGTRYTIGHLDNMLCFLFQAGGGVKDDVLEQYCWMYAHFKIPLEYQGPCSGADQGNLEGPIYNSYYQWVPIFLMFIAILFYVPRCLWVMMEGGLMKFFGKGTTTRLIEEPEEKRDKLVKFFSDNIHNKYNIYYFGFMVCEMLNTVVAIIAYLLTNRFLNHEFLFYGFETWLYYKLPPEEQRISINTNPMCRTFPRIAACDYYRFGSGGGQEKVNAICILALNIINDKVIKILRMSFNKRNNIYEFTQPFRSFWSCGGGTSFWYLLA